MSVPALLLTVDCQVDVNILIVLPLLDDLLVIEQIILGTRAVYNIDTTVSNIMS